MTFVAESLGLSSRNGQTERIFRADKARSFLTEIRRLCRFDLLVAKCAKISINGSTRYRLFFYLHRVICPNCSVFIEYNTLPEVLPDCEKTCPQCTKAFLAIDGIGKPLKKRPQGSKSKRIEALVQ